MIKHKVTLTLLPLLTTLIIAGCGGGGGTPTASITSFELLDPTPGVGDLFGQNVLLLPNGNIVVTDPRNSSVASLSGAVHLYDPRSQMLIASIYGDIAGDQLGSNGVTALGNNNFVIASSFDDEGGILDAGSVRLVNGTTGMQIGDTLAGDIAGDKLGIGSITALGNNNFVIVSEADDVGGIVDAGSVRLVSGTTGVQIGSTIAGSVADDIDSAQVIGSASGDFYILSIEYADNNNLVNSGQVRLIAQ